MQTLTEDVYALAPSGSVFDDAVVCNLFPHASPGARKLLVHRAVGAGEVSRIKPGLYCLAEAYRRSHLHPFVGAALLRSPSHVSLESALSHHGLIPEAIGQVSSVTIRRSREFHTPLGIFTFSRVPSVDPRAGVDATKVDELGWAFVASPLRSTADLIYNRK
jgi:predicted transcriptional regulator of viral defense system